MGKLFRAWRKNCGCGALTFAAGMLLIFAYIRYPTLNCKVSAKLRSNKIGHTAGTSSHYAVDYMQEEVDLKLPACSDHKLAADLKNSKISIKDSTEKVYRLGDTIYVSIKLYNGYGKPVTKGGAILRAQMVNTSKTAFATSHVKDHGDGSYTAEFEASWTGKSTISVQINYTPETIRAKYYIRQKRTTPVPVPNVLANENSKVDTYTHESTPKPLEYMINPSDAQAYSACSAFIIISTREIEGIFSVGQYKEAKLCHPTWETFKGVRKSEICNLTADNSGMPWYCGKPNITYLLCEDWTAVNNRMPPPVLPITNCETVLLNRSGQYIKKHLEVDIVGEEATGAVIISLPKTPCRDFNVTSLWTRKQTTGFLYNDKWHLRHCKGPESSTLFECLKNRKFLLLGDSTVRQWYHHFQRIGKCSPSAQLLTRKHKRIGCENKKHNFTIQWLPHSQPFFGANDLNRYTRTSISRHLDETGNDERVIALVHIHMHTIAYHHSVFRKKIRRIRVSVESLLNRNKFAKVLIKGPHTFTTGWVWGAEVSDFYGLVYRHIWYEEFSGLHDRVIFLDNSDINNAITVEDIHPPGTVVSAMVDQMLAYIC